MVQNENNQDLIKLIRDGQKTQRWTTIGSAIGAIAALTTAITSGILIWKSLKRGRASSKMRLIRQKGRIDKMKLRHQAEMARELLELEILEKIAKHEAELRELEVGLENKEEKEVISETDNFIANLKNKGTAGIKEQMNKFKEKIPNPLDKEKKS